MPSRCASAIQRARWGRPALSRPARRLPRGFRTCNRYWPARAAPPAARPGRRPVRPAPRRAPRWRRPRPSPGPSARRRSANRRRADAAGKTLACHLLHFWNRTRRTIRRRNKAPDHALRAYRGFHSQKVNSGGNHCRGYRHCRRAVRAAVEADLGSHDRKAGGGAAIRDFPDKSSRNDTTTGIAGVTIALRKIPRTAPCPRAAPGRSRTQGLMRDGFRCPSAPGATIDDA